MLALGEKRNNLQSGRWRVQGAGWLSKTVARYNAGRSLKCPKRSWNPRECSLTCLGKTLRLLAKPRDFDFSGSRSFCPVAKPKDLGYCSALEYGMQKVLDSIVSRMEFAFSLPAYLLCLSAYMPACPPACLFACFHSCLPNCLIACLHGQRLNG